MNEQYTTEKLLEMTKRFPQTQYWNDSCSVAELTYAIKRGAVGATTNPVIVKQVLSNELENYRNCITGFIEENPTSSEDEIAWMVIEKMAVDGAKLLKPMFDPTTGKGRISIQTNTKNYNNAQRLLEQTLHFAELASNIQVKIPTTAAGIKAIEEATYHGVSVNATVSFTATQAIAVAEAVEHGLNRREAEGKSNAEINPIVTIMVGRLDDWLKDVVKREPEKYPALFKSLSGDYEIGNSPLDYAGIACMKKAYAIFKERGYKSRLLAAAYRYDKHWTEFIGGDLSMTIPYKYQQTFNASSAELRPLIDENVSDEHMTALLEMPDFQKAYNTMEISEFDHYGAVNKTLLQFAEGYDDLIKIIRSFMIHI